MQKSSPIPKNDHELQEYLRSFPLLDPPTDITQQIMANITIVEKRSLRRWWQIFFAPTAIFFRPVYLLPLVLVALISFWFGSAGFLGIGGAHKSPALTIDNAKAAYLIGRGYIENNDFFLSQQYLFEATRLAPNNPEYAYWLGVAYWKKNDLQQEQESYLRGIESNPDSYSLLVNLGHSYLNSANFREALATYHHALHLQPDSTPEVLYNIALIYGKLNLQEQEIQSWKTYLQYQRKGQSAFHAMRRLQELEDNSYRQYLIGKRQVILSQRKLLDNMLSKSVLAHELEELSILLEHNVELEIDIVVFSDKNEGIAKKVAKNIKSALLRSAEISERIHLSWFSRPEVQLNEKQKSISSQGVQIFARPSNLPQHEV